MTNLQLELLKLFNYELSDEQLLEIKELLSNYFAQQATDEMDKVWDEQGLTEGTMDKWLNERHRSSS